MTSAVATSTWQLFPHVIFYRTGFPYELMERLRCAATVAALEQVAASTEVVEALRAELRAGFPAWVHEAHLAKDRVALRALSAARSRVGRLRAVPPQVLATLQERGAPAAQPLARWNTLLARHADLLVAATAAYDVDLARTRGALRDVAADRTFQEALFTSNPNLYPRAILRYLDNWRSEMRAPSARRFERALTSYVQRGTTKTDVAGLFGPINFARLDRDEPRAIRLEMPRDCMVAQRETFLSFWAVEALAARVARDPKVRPWLRPRLHPACEVRGGRLYHHITDEHIELSGLQAAMLPHADGRTSVTEIAAQVGCAVPETLAALDQLAQRGTVALDVPVPSTIFHPFRTLLGFVASLPPACATRDAWLYQLQSLDADRLAFRDGDLDQRVQRLGEMERRFERLAGVPARRSAGQSYADRTIVYEDCEGTAGDVRFGAPFVADLEQRLSASLELCSAYGVLYRQHYRWMAEQAYRSLVGETRSAVSFSSFVRRLQQMGRAGVFPARSAAIERFERDWTALVARRTEEHGGRRACLDAEDVRGLSESVQRAHGYRNVHAAPDLLLSARSLLDLQRGEYRVIVGEVGENIYVWGSQFYFYNRREEAEQAVASMLASLPEYKPFAIILAPRPHKGLLSEAFAGTFVEAGAITERSSSENLPFRDLFVVAGEDGPALVSRDGRRFQFFHHHDDLVHLWAFAPPRIAIPPLHPGTHQPRIEVDGVVLQRERWNLTPAELLGPAADGFNRFRQVRQAKQRLGLPDQLFVHVPGEVKPWGIDLTSALSVELLAGAVDGAREVRIVEMLPSPDELWLGDDRGRYCTEFRFLAYRS